MDTDALRANFNRLVQACQQPRGVALVATQTKDNGVPIFVICIVREDGDRLHMEPIALLPVDPDVAWASLETPGANVAQEAMPTPRRAALGFDLNNN